MIKFNHISVLITWAWLVFGLLNPCQAQTVSDLQQQKDELFLPERTGESVFIYSVLFAAIQGQAFGRDVGQSGVVGVLLR